MTWTVIIRNSNSQTAETYPSRAVAARCVSKFKKAVVIRDDDRRTYTVAAGGEK